MRKFYSKMITLLLIAVFAGACSKIKINSKVMDAIKAATTECKIEIDYGWSKNRNCPAMVKLKKMFGTNNERLASLGTVAVALHDDDIKIAAVAASVLYSHFKGYMKDFKGDKKALTPAIVDKLITGVAKRRKYNALYAARTAGHAAILTGKEGAFYKMLEAHPDDDVKVEGYTYIMTYGRLDAFGKIQELAKSSNAKIHRAAVYAPQWMYQYTDAEKGKVCPWVKGFLADADIYTAGNAVSFLARTCKGEYIDAALDTVEAQKDKQKFKTLGYRLWVGCKKSLISSMTGTAKQCKRYNAIQKTLKKK